MFSWWGSWLLAIMDALADPKWVVKGGYSETEMEIVPFIDPD